MESQSTAIGVLGGNENGHVQEVLRQAHDELRHLFQQRADVMRRIGTIKQTIAGLANLFGDSVLNDELLELIDRKSSGRQTGFTKACRTWSDGGKPRHERARYLRPHPGEHSRT